MARQQMQVTRKQVELAQAKVEADEALGLQPDPLLVMIADAGRRPTPAAESARRAELERASLLALTEDLGRADAEVEAKREWRRRATGSPDIFMIDGEGRLYAADVKTGRRDLTEAEEAIGQVVRALASHDPAVKRSSVVVLKGLTKTDLKKTPGLASIVELAVSRFLKDDPLAQEVVAALPRQDASFRQSRGL